MSDEETFPDVLVITFGVSITNPQLDNLDAEWSYYTVPVSARERLIADIDAAIAEMSDEYGRIQSTRPPRPNPSNSTGLAATE